MLATAALTLGAAACGDDDDDAASTPEPSRATTTTEAPRQEPRRGGTVTYVHTLDPRSLDPVGLSAASSGGDAAHAFALYDALLIEDPETADVVPQLAESLESTDALAWTLKLRSGVRFTDGTPYDAEAVKFNIERHADPAIRAQNLSYAQGIQSMEVVDPLTLRITLKEANGQFPRVMARRLGFVGSPTAIRQKGEGFGTSPVGAGPFTLTEWVRNGHLRFQRNPNYWNAPRPYIDELVIRPIPDGEQRLNTLQTGGATVMYSGAIPLFGKRAEQAGFPVYRLPNPVLGIQLQMNLQRPPFNDIRARRAVAVGVDMNQFNATINQGAGTAPTHLIRPPSPFHEPSLALPTYNPEEAQRLIDEYARDTGGPLRFAFLVGDSVAAYGEFFQAQLARDRNIETSIEIFPGIQFPPRLSMGDFQIATFGLSGLDPEPDFYDHFHSTGARNYPKYSNPEVDRALEVGRRNLNREERKQAYAAVQRNVVRDIPDLWLDTADQYFAYQDELQDYAMSGTFPLWDRMWLDE